MEDEGWEVIEGVSGWRWVTPPMPHTELSSKLIAPGLVRRVRLPRHGSRILQAERDISTNRSYIEVSL